jgi:hypothetical protein
VAFPLYPGAIVILNALEMRMNALETWFCNRRPSYRIYFLIFTACVALHVSSWSCALTSAGYFLFESLDDWIIRLRGDRVHDIVMNIFEPDPDDPQKEVKAEWFWERLTRVEATVLTWLANLIRLSR